MDIPTDIEERSRNLPNLPNRYSFKENVKVKNKYRSNPQEWVEQIKISGIKSTTSMESCGSNHNRVCAPDEILHSAHKSRNRPNILPTGMMNNMRSMSTFNL